MDDIKELLRKKIQEETSKLDGLEVGSNEYKAVVDGITKLTDRLVEIEKLEHTKYESEKTYYQTKERDKLEKEKFEFSKSQSAIDNSIKSDQLREEKKDHIIKNVVSIVIPVATLFVTVWGTLASFQFEKEGTVTTIMGRGFINKLLPKK